MAMSEAKFYYARLTTPAKIRAGFDGDEPMYQNCAECKADEPTIVGCIKDSRDHQVAITPVGNGVTFRSCYYCGPCFDRLTGVTDRIDKCMVYLKSVSKMDCRGCDLMPYCPQPYKGESKSALP